MSYLSINSTSGSEGGSSSSVFAVHQQTSNNYGDQSDADTAVNLLSTSSPMIEATDEEEHDLGVYGLGHHNKSLPLSDSSPVNDDSGTGCNSNHSDSRTEGRLSDVVREQNTLNLLDPSSLTPTRASAIINASQRVGPYYVVGQSSDSNLYSLDDDGALFDGEEAEEEIFTSNPPPQDAKTSPSSSQRTVIQNSFETTTDSASLKKQISQISQNSCGTMRSRVSNVTSSRRCQCVECQMLEQHYEDDNLTVKSNKATKHRPSTSSQHGTASRKNSKKNHPPTSLSIDSNRSSSRLHHHPSTYLHRHNQVSPGVTRRQQQDQESANKEPSLTNASDDRNSHVSGQSQESPPLFYAIRDGVIFQPGLPPSLSIESMRNAPPPSSAVSQTAAPNRRRLDQLFGSTNNTPSISSKQRHHHHHNHHKQKHHHKTKQPPQAATAPLRTKQRHHTRGHGGHHRHQPKVPPSSPTVASRHFGVDTGGYPLTSSRRDLATTTGDAVLLNNFGSFRVIIERIKHWFLVKSRKILSPRNLFGRSSSTGLKRSASSLSSLAASTSSLSGASTSSSTSLCDSDPSLTDIGLAAPPFLNKVNLLAPPAALTTINTPAVMITKISRSQREGSSDSLASSDSANSLLEFKRRVGKQRREMAEREKLLQTEPQHNGEESQRQHRQKQYLQIHDKNGAFTVTSTISCPTGRAPAGRPTRRGNQRAYQYASSTTAGEFGGLQLSASWPVVDRLAIKLVQQQADAFFGQALAMSGNQQSADIDAAFYNENDTVGQDYPHATMAERRAGWRHHLTQQTQDSARDSVCSDCAIPFQDLEFGECVRDSDGHKIFSGRWYGTVMIHLFSGFSDRDVGAFWSEVHKMVTLRHDNVALFMGAAVERSALAIVISVQTHISLFDQIHINGTSMAPNVLTIGRQLAQGMGYLHSRNIVLGHLNSRNVFIDGKLKISMADCSKPRRDYVKLGCACLSRGVVTYLAPELLKSLSIVYQQQHINLPPKICFQQAPTADTDVYAFGTLMYEVAFSAFPFAETPLEVVIYQIASGSRADFNVAQSPTSTADSSLLTSIRQLIEDCWCHDPLMRPLFKDIYRHIQDISPSNNQGLAEQQRRRCSSVPERLGHLISAQRGGGIAYY